MKTLTELEKELILRNCQDCEVAPGTLHAFGCDVERCALCGGQMIGCDCVYEMSGMDPLRLEEQHPDIYKGGATAAMWAAYDAAVAPYGGRLPWTGVWPGVVECIEFGWFCYWGPGWRRCSKEHPGATADLNRLHEGNATWSREKRRWLLKDDTHAPPATPPLPQPPSE